MGKKKKEVPEDIKPAPLPEMKDLFVGGEEDDLSDMQYIQDETTTTTVDTMPPETKEEAAARAEAEPKDDESDESEEEEEVTDETEEAPVVLEAKEEEEAAPKDSEAIKVPKDRFDEVNQRMKIAEEQNKLLKKQVESLVKPVDEPKPEPYDYATKEKEAMAALLEGDDKKYAELRSEIRTAERAETLREAKKLAQEGDQHMQETMTFDEAAAQIEADYPAFAEDNANYNQAAREELLDLYLGYAQSGNYTRVQALQRAAEKAAKLHDIKALSVVPPAVPDNVVKLKQPDPKKKAEIANNQPPVMESKGDVDNGEPKVDMRSMSDEEFSTLPESAKRRLRGDIV